MAYIKLPISSQPLMIPASDFPSLRVVFYTTMVDIKLLVSIQHLPIPANDFPLWGWCSTPWWFTSNFQFLLKPCWYHIRKQVISLLGLSCTHHNGSHQTYNFGLAPLLMMIPASYFPFCISESLFQFVSPQFLTKDRKTCFQLQNEWSIHGLCVKADFPFPPPPLRSKWGHVPKKQPNLQSNVLLLL
jgi:hypothetical protein